MTLTTTRTPRGVITDLVNQCTNPSFEVDTAGWQYSWSGTAGVATNDRDTGTGYPGAGTASIRKKVTTAASGPIAEFGFYYPVASWAAGTTLWVSGSLMVFTDTQIVCIRAKFYDAGGTLLSYQDSTHTTSSFNSFIRLSGTFTAPANAVRGELWFVTTGETTHAIPVNAGLLLDGVLLTTADQTGVPYFDGTSAPFGSYTFGWSGTAHASASIRYLPDPASIVSPLLVLGWDEQQAAGNLFHVLLSGAVVGVQRAGAKRSGTLHLFFGTNRAAAMSARAQHQITGTWSYQDTDLPETSISYMVAGPVHLANDDERTHWTLDVPFQEV